MYGFKIFINFYIIKKYIFLIYNLTNLINYNINLKI